MWVISELLCTRLSTVGWSLNNVGLTMFYKEENRRLSSEEIQNLCSSCCKEMETLLSDQDIKYIEEVTRVQSTSQVWIEQRIGRITSSVVYQFLHTSQSYAAPSLICNVCYKGQKSISSLPAVRHGIENENNAYLLYSHILAGTPCPDVRPTGKILMSRPGPHQDFTLTKAGLYISKEKPFLGACPDGIISCSCCGKGALEIKCPFKYISGLQGVAGSSDYSVCLLITHLRKGMSIMLKSSYICLRPIVFKLISSFGLQLMLSVLGLDAMNSSFLTWLFIPKQYGSHLFSLSF